MNIIGIVGNYGFSVEDLFCKMEKSQVREPFFTQGLLSVHGMRNV